MQGPKWPLLLILIIYEPDVVMRLVLGQVLYLGRAPRTKETLPVFSEWCRVTRHPRVFRGLTGCQRTPRFWGVTGYGCTVWSFTTLSECWLGLSLRLRPM